MNTVSYMIRGNGNDDSSSAKQRMDQAMSDSAAQRTSTLHPRNCRELHGDDTTVVCFHCKLPVCLECYSRLWTSKPSEYSIPAAIANDNFQGYIHPFIVRHRVRWIEAVVACPYLTTIVQYYVEGHPRQRHHLADERMGEHERAMAFRGNVFAYHLPWEMILQAASTATPADFLKHWPQKPSTVSHLVKALFVNTTEEHTLSHLKELHIRAFVLVGLGKIYIENGHEDMIKLGCPDAAEHDYDAKKEAAIESYTKEVEKGLWKMQTEQTPIYELCCTMFPFR